MKEEIIQHPQIIQEEKGFKKSRLVIAFFLELALLLSFLWISYNISLNFTKALIIAMVFFLASLITIFALVTPYKTRNVYSSQTKVLREKPIVKVKTVKEVVTKKVAPKKKKLNIPKYKYRGSTQTMTYHTRNCRFSKLIKPKYKVSNNNINFFKRNKFHPCKICKPNIVKKR